MTAIRISLAAYDGVKRIAGVQVVARREKLLSIVSP
jgi:hypothetical protein